MATLVVGPSSVGKSTYISNLEPKNEKIRLGFEVPELSIDNSITFVHYNLLHPFFTSSEGKHPLGWRETLHQEPIFNEILQSQYIKNVIILVEPVKILLSRAKTRQYTEPTIRMKENLPDYPQQTALKVIKTTNLFELYEYLFELFTNKNIPYKILTSTKRRWRHKNSYLEVDELLVHKILRDEAYAKPNNREIEKFIASSDFNYQKVSLPGKRSLNSKGYDHVGIGRDASFKAIFKNEDLRSKSILDIGSATGDFLFKAERLGADYLLGLEPNLNRYMAAKSIAKLLKSRSQFKMRSLEKYLTKSWRRDVKKFDYVLCLNVIHHVSDIQDFFDKSATLSRNYIVFEFPCLENTMWLEDNGQVKSDVKIPNLLPLVGLGSRGYDLRFVFNDQAIITLMRNANPDFRVLERINSPILNRRIIIFQKSQIKSSI